MFLHRAILECSFSFKWRIFGPRGRNGPHGVMYEWSSFLTPPFPNTCFAKLWPLLSALSWDPPPLTALSMTGDPVAHLFKEKLTLQANSFCFKNLIVFLGQGNKLTKLGECIVFGLRGPTRSGLCESPCHSCCRRGLSPPLSMTLRLISALFLIFQSAIHVHVVST